MQAARMGAYTKLPNVTQAGRPVYQLVNSTVMYLFYWPSTSRWLIGNYSSGSSGVRSSGNAAAACPDQAVGWQVVVAGGGWVSTYPITVAPAAGLTRPPTLPTTAAPTNAGKRTRYVRMRST